MNTLNKMQGNIILYDQVMQLFFNFKHKTKQDLEIVFLIYTVIMSGKVQFFFTDLPVLRTLV